MKRRAPTRPVGGGARTVFLIDGTAFCYRAFHALPELTTHDGRPTNAVYGFALMLQSLLEKERPDYLAVAFDVGKPTFRHRRYHDYKVQRRPMPEALVAQLPVIKSLLAAYGVPMFEVEGYEGEDVLATIAKRVARPDLEVFLVTGDKDALQLVESRIKVYNPHKAEGIVLDAEAVRQRYGVSPEQMVDLMALMGDAIDNIPGVPGIGEKTAAKLLQRFGSVSQLYRRLDEVESVAQRERLASAREQAELSRELARIDCEVPVEVHVQDLAVREPDWQRLRVMFRELEFTRLLAVAEAKAPAAPQRGVTVRIVTDDTELSHRLKTWTASGGPAALLGFPVGGSTSALALAIAMNPDTAWVVPLDRARLAQPSGQRLARWLADPSVPVIGHELKTMVRRLAELGLELEGVCGDTLLAAYLLNPSRPTPRLTDLVEEWLDERLAPVPTGEGISDLELPKAAEAAGRAACAVLTLHERLLVRLREHRLEPLYREIELPLIKVLAEMERTGIAVDLSYLKRLHASMEARLTQLTQELYRLAGVTFNLNSPRQLAHVLFERLGLAVVKRTKTGPSTDAEVLQQLAPQHPLPQRLMEYRELAKLVSTYVDALPRLADLATGRIHTSFNQAATATGRLSSSEPNLQNIPVKTELGRQIRRAFVPGGADWLFVAVDYSQIELRILAHLSKDPALLDAFRQRRDIHRHTASLIYGLPEAEVQPEQRNAMKAVNYGILYGMSAHGLAKELGIPREEAQAFIDAYFERYPKVRQYLDAQIAHGRKTGCVETLLGRRRYIPEVNSADPMVRQFGERMAVNTPIQGSAADLIKRAMLEVFACLRAQQLVGRMVLQVHDELLFEVPREEHQALIAAVRPLMEHVLPLAIPITVTVKIGPNWLDLTPVE